MLKNEMESYVRIEGRGLKNFMYPYMGVGGVKNCQNHPYVINEWPLIPTSSSLSTRNSVFMQGSFICIRITFYYFLRKLIFYVWLLLENNVFPEEVSLIICSLQHLLLPLRYIQLGSEYFNSDVLSERLPHFPNRW